MAARARPRNLTVALLAAALSGAVLTPIAAAANLLDLRVAAPGTRARRLGEVAGSGPTLIAMAASYCPPCRAEVPVLARAARRWRSAGLRVLTVVVDVDHDADLRALVRAWGISYDAYAVAPGQEDQLEALLAGGVPTTFVVKDGTITRHDRFLSDADLEALVPKLLGPPAPGHGGPVAEPS